MQSDIRQAQAQAWAEKLRAMESVTASWAEHRPVQTNARSRLVFATQNDAAPAPFAPTQKFQQQVRSNILAVDSSQPVINAASHSPPTQPGVHVHRHSWSQVWQLSPNALIKHWDSEQGERMETRTLRPQFTAIDFHT